MVRATMAFVLLSMPLGPAASRGQSAKAWAVPLPNLRWSGATDYSRCLFLFFGSAALRCHHPSCSLTLSVSATSDAEKPSSRQAFFNRPFGATESIFKSPSSSPGQLQRIHQTNLDATSVDNLPRTVFAAFGQQLKEDLSTNERHSKLHFEVGIEPLQLGSFACQHPVAHKE